MFSKKILGSLAGLGFLLCINSGIAIAQTPPVEMPVPSSEQTEQFRRIEQPLGLKVGVTTGGIALIGLELWWFLFIDTPRSK